MVKHLLHKLSLRRKKPREQFMITIPDPCNEQWSEMKKVDDCHRHCAACDRTLTDFSRMSDDELILFFKQSVGKICGRFRKDQLNRPLTKLPEQTSRAQWWKAAALLPLTLFSKSATAQQLQKDSVQTELPSMCISDPVNEVPPVDSIIQWNWIDTEEQPWRLYEVTGGVPFIITTLPLPICVTISDSLFSAPPPIAAQAHVGVSFTSAEKKEHPVKAMQFANRFTGALHEQQHKQ